MRRPCSFEQTLLVALLATGCGSSAPPADPKASGTPRAGAPIAVNPRGPLPPPPTKSVPSVPKSAPAKPTVAINPTLVPARRTPDTPAATSITAVPPGPAELTVDPALLKEITDRIADPKSSPLANLPQTWNSPNPVGDWEQIIVEGWKSSGVHDAARDGEVEKFLRTACRRYAGATDAPEYSDLAARGEQLLESGLKDPVVIIALGLLHEVLSTDESTNRLRQLLAESRTLSATPNLPPRLTYWLTRLELHVAYSYRGINPHRFEQVRSEYVQAAAMAAADPELTDADRTRLLYDIVYAFEQKGMAGRELQLVSALNDSAPDPWLSRMLIAHCDHNQGWRARGGGGIDTVSEEKAREFTAYLTRERRLLAEAWKLRPDLPHAPARLIEVVMAVGGLADEGPRFWFDRAVEVQPEWDPAYKKMLWALRPRWGGSHAEMLAFGRECLQTRRFDTGIPRCFHQAVKDAAGELSPPNSILQEFDLHADYVALEEGYGTEFSTMVAVAALFSGRSEEARTRLEQLGPQIASRDFKAFEADLRRVRRALHPPELDNLAVGLNAQTDTLALLQGGKVLATGDFRDGVRLWSTETGEPESDFLEDSRGVATLSAPADGRRLAICDHSGRVRIYDPESKTFVRTLHLGGEAYPVAFSPDGKWLAVGGQGPEHPLVRVWNAETGATEWDIADLPGFPRHVAFSPDGTQVVGVTQRERGVLVWSLADKRLVYQNSEFPATPLVGAFAADGKSIAIGGWRAATRDNAERGLIQLVSLSSQAVSSSTTLPLPVASMLFAPDGTFLADTGGTLVVYRSPIVAPTFLLGHRPALLGLAMDFERGRAYSSDEEGGVRAWSIAHEDRASRVDLALTEMPYQGTISDLRSTPKRSSLACLCETGGFTVWDSGSGWRQARQFIGDAEDEVLKARFDAGENLIATLTRRSSSRKIEVDLWSMATRQKRRTIREPRSASSLAVSPDGRSVAVGYDNGRLMLYEAATGQPWKWATSGEHRNAILALEFSPDGRTLISAGKDGPMRFWDMPEDPTTVKLPMISEAAVTGLETTRGMVLSDDQKTLLTLHDRFVQVWDFEQRASRGRVKGHWAAFAPDGRRFVTAGGELVSEARIWDTATLKELGRLAGGHADSITAVAFPEGTRLLTGSKDQSVCAWDAQSFTEVDLAANRTWSVSRGTAPKGAPPSTPDPITPLTTPAPPAAPVLTLTPAQRLAGHESPVWAVAVLADGKRAVSGSGIRGMPNADNSVRVWDLESGREAGRFTHHTDRVLSVSAASQGTQVLSGSQNNEVCLWDANSPARALRTERDRGQIVAFSADAKSMLVGRAGVLSLDRIDGTRRHALELGSQALWSLSLDAQQLRAVSCGGRNPDFSVWNVATGKRLRNLYGHTDAVSWVALSSDGKVCVSSSHDATVRVWDVESGAVRHTLSGHSGPVFTAALSPDGKRVASGGKDASVRIWETDTGRELARGAAHSGEVRGLAFSPDGRTLVSGAGDKLVFVWDLRSLK